ncbi:invasion antigen B [Campylobacter devanensis]|uniref:Invasion antigen B n=1 Tax=Campylobacter devanensis TaxID=3161138 RepID=A0A1X9SSY0_9BACT|nr:invasion protein CiaB [Campylobacter lanienae]ARQ99384.1 invasion antigen B [Campylobacter lanienae]SUX02575.1 invasion antigen B [Campylobacter lanienae]
MSYKRLNEISKSFKNELNQLYKDMDNPIILQGLKIANLANNSQTKIAITDRIVSLRTTSVENELKRLGLDKGQIREVNANLYDFVSKFYIDRFSKMLNLVSQEGLLSEFEMELLWSVHRVGIVITNMHKVWQRHIIERINDEFETKFDNIAQAMKFINDNELYQLSDGLKCDRVYGAVIKDIDGYKMTPYILAFPSECGAVVSELQNSINSLKSLAKSDQDIAYIEYFEALKLAFSECENDRVISKWQDVERAWMKTRSAIQIGHPLEYYEDAYTHAVALEWDVRLSDQSGIDEGELKNQIKDSFDQIYSQIEPKNSNMASLVHSNIDKTQLYICAPMLYYGAEFNGLFSAQVVPNDEIVSGECGKKIFAFVDFVYQSSKAKPFMKLASEIFDKEFLDYGREILFNNEKIWKQVYEISTIGHEFGHILFMDSDSENLMNIGGEFKFIEEYKATTGGLVNFFLHEKNELILPVFAELIKRSVGLIAWQKVVETRAYYCEGLIHLTLLFRAGVLGFDGKRLRLNFNQQSYEKFKSLTLENYIDLASYYIKKINASEFLAKFAYFDGEIYLPNDAEMANFVKYYYNRYEMIGNEIDESGEWQKWQN